MPRTILRLAVAVLLPLLLLPIAPATSASANGWSDDTLVTVIPATAIGTPMLDWPWIVWDQLQPTTDPSTTDSDIYALNLDTGATSIVASGPGDQRVGAVSDGVVAWTSIGTLYVTELAIGDTRVVGETGATWDAPDISGRWMVWHAVTAESEREHVLYARDIWTMSEPIVLDRGRYEANAGFPPLSSPHVSGDIVVWQRRDDTDSRLTQVVYSDLSDGQGGIASVQSDADPGGGFDFENGVIVFGTPSASQAANPGTITMIDLFAWQWRVVPAGVSFHEGGFPITTDGSTVLWVGRFGDTYGYDIAGDALFELPVTRWDISIEDGTLAWIRERAADATTEVHLAPVSDFATGRRSRYFPETDRWLGLGYLRYWESGGGLPVFGYPLQVAYDGVTVWVERQRLEWHPEHSGTVYEIQLCRLGAELLTAQGRNWMTYPTADPSTQHYMAATGHAIDARFWDYWSGHGLEFGDPGISFRESLALFGYPISEPFMTTNADGHTVLTQYFERAVFEWHPDNPEPYRVLLRRLGAEEMTERGW
jgi:hypothetical protein